MSYFDDNEDRITGLNLGRRGQQPLRAAPQDPTCRTCGADCYWQEVVAGDGRVKPRLFENGKPHVCKPSSDDFDVVTA